MKPIRFVGSQAVLAAKNALRERTLNPIRIFTETKRDLLDLNERLPDALINGTHEELLAEHGLSIKSFPEIRKRRQQVLQAYQDHSRLLSDYFHSFILEDGHAKRQELSEQALQHMNALSEARGIRVNQYQPFEPNSKLMLGALQHGLVQLNGKPVKAGVKIEDVLLKEYQKVEGSNTPHAVNVKAGVAAAVGELKENKYELTNRELIELIERPRRERKLAASRLAYEVEEARLQKAKRNRK